MRRSLSALFTVAIAALLSIVLAVPASAADSWWEQYATKTTNKVQYKYGYDYYSKLPKSPISGNPNGPVGAKIPVAPSVNPSATGPSFYLDQARNRVVNPANIPLEGKIIQPGQTLVRPSSTYAAVTKFATPGVAGLGRLLGTLGVGIGGTSTPPSNWKELSLAQGVPQTCVDDLKSCGKPDMDKVFSITSCGLKNTCNSIGAVQEEESDMGKWFKNEALPFLDDLWAQITGQKNDAVTDSNEHQIVDPRGCLKEYGVEYRGNNNVTLHTRVTVDKGRPADGTGAQTYYDQGCGVSVPMVFSTPGMMETTCLDKSTGQLSVDYTRQGLNGADWNPDGTNKTGMCSYLSPSVRTLYKIRFWNPNNQAWYNDSPTTYVAVQYSEWINPDPTLGDQIEDTTITTTWDCRAADGTVYTYTKSISKTAAMVSPDCPFGSELIRHDVTATQGRDVSTIDAGAEKPGGLSAFPLCQTNGCTMNVYLDGTVCAATRPECSNWPAIATATPSRITCKWGSYTMPRSDCNSLSNGYKTETGIIFDPHSGTWVAIDPYGRPVDANPEPWNNANPNPSPGNKPGTTTTTPGSTSGFPGTGVSPSDNCVSPFWSWNPVDWVKSPAICAIQDSFVPKTDLTARMENIKTTTLGLPPISWISPAMTGPGGGGCPNWNITIPGLGSKNVVCESSFTAAILGVRGPMFGLLATAMVWPLLRSLYYAAIPILRVSPSGSK